jgi:hypothetical protein
MEIMSVVEQEIIRAYREITEQGKKVCEIPIDDDLTVKGEYNRATGIVTIEVYGASING